MTTNNGDSYHNRDRQLLDAQAFTGREGSRAEVDEVTEILRARVNDKREKKAETKEEN